MTAVEASDERVHRPPRPDPRWAERWSFDFWCAAEGFGGVVEVAWVPAAKAARYAACLVGPGRPHLVVVAEQVPMAEPSPSIEFRHEGLWAMHVCETPLEHWTVGLEAYGVELDDPDDALTRPWGRPTGLGYDLEWEAVAPADALAPGSYRQACRITGEVLVGVDEFPAIDAVGWRRHRWGTGVEAAVGWTAWWDVETDEPLGEVPRGVGASSVLAEAPVAVGGTWRERRRLVQRGPAVGWVAVPLDD